MKMGFTELKKKDAFAALKLLTFMRTNTAPKIVLIVLKPDVNQRKNQM